MSDKEGYIQVHKYYGEMPQKMTSRARNALRKAIAEHDDFNSDALSADCILERVWNAITVEQY